MKIIDRYLLRQFIQTFLICFLSLTGLFIVLDALTHIEDFLKCAEKHGGLASLMGEYYAYRSLLFFDLTAGMLALVSAMFTITWIQRHNEMTALMAAGMPRVPRGVASDRGGRDDRRVDHRQPGTRASPGSRRTGPIAGRPGGRNRAKMDLALRRPDRHRHLRRGDRREGPPDPEAELPTAAVAGPLRKPVGRRDGHVSSARGRPARRIPAQGRQPAEGPGDEAVAVARRRAGRHHATRRARLARREDECFVVSNVTFDLLTDGLAYASTAQLIAGLRNPGVDFGADVRVEIHSRIVHPLLDVTLLFLGTAAGVDA